MPDGYLVSRDLLRQIQRDHSRIKYELKTVAGQVSRLSTVAPVRDEQIIAQAQAEVAAIDSTSSEPLVTSGKFKVLFLDREDEKLKQLSDYEVTAWNVTGDDIEKDAYVTLNRNSVTGKWVISPNNRAVIRFRLKEDPKAYKRPSDTSTQYWYASADKITFAYDPDNDDSTDNGLTLGPTDSDEVTVYDPYGKFRFAKGPRTHPDGSDLEGSYGYAELIKGAWHIIECETVAKFINFAVDNTAGYTQADNVWNINSLFNPIDGIHPGDSITTVLNWQVNAHVSPVSYLFEGVDGATGLAQFQDDNLSSGTYYYKIIQLEVDCGAS